MAQTTRVFRRVRAMRLRPWRLWLPRFAEVGELADVVDFHLAGVLAQLASSCLEPLDQLGAADDARGWLGGR